MEIEEIEEVIIEDIRMIKGLSDHTGVVGQSLRQKETIDYGNMGKV